MTRRRWLALTTSLPACSTRKASNGEHLIRVGVAQGTHSVAPLFLAGELGYFREAGIRIEVDRAAFTGLHISALAAGKLDVALVALSPALVNAVARDAPIRIVASRRYLGPRCGAWGQFFASLAAFPGRLRNFSELKGKRIGYSTPGSLSDFAVDVVLDAAGLTREQVKAVAIKRQESIAVLMAGGLDAVMNVPSIQEVPEDRRAGFEFLCGAETIHPTLQTSFTAFGERLRGPDREMGIRFLRAMQLASDEFAAGKHAEFRRKWAVQQGSDPDALITSCPHETASAGQVNLDSVKLYVQWAGRRGLIEGTVAPEALVEGSFAAAVRQGETV